MAAENHNGGRSPSDNPTKVDRSLDDLARELATSNVSRGRALKIMGSALLGSVLAAVPGVAWANKDRCSQGETRCGDRCVNLRTNERHCGSCSNRCGSKQTCCNGRCVNLKRSERHCGSCSNRCDDGEQCVRGECQGGGCTGIPLTEGDCTCASTCGADLSQFTCQDDPRCTCLETTEGTGFCGRISEFVCGNFILCSSSSDCPETHQCIVSLDSPECCGTHVCAPSCSVPGGVGQSAASRESG
jgi:hypothetical protein